MKEELIKYKTAVLARECGFDEPVKHAYNLNGNLEEYSGLYNADILGSYLSAPTQSLLQRWLREVHGIHVNPFLSTNWKVYSYSVLIPSLAQTSSKAVTTTGKDFKTYEEALEEGLLHALTMLKDEIQNT